MDGLDTIKRPSKSDQRLAGKSYNSLSHALRKIGNDKGEIEIEDIKERITIPSSALKILAEVLKAMSKGQPVSIVPIATEVTTQKAADILGCSRPFLVGLLEKGKIPFSKVGRHRRILFEDLIRYKQKQKEQQKKLIIKIMQEDEKDGLYDL